MINNFLKIKKLIFLNFILIFSLYSKTNISYWSYSDIFRFVDIQSVTVNPAGTKVAYVVKKTTNPQTSTSYNYNIYISDIDGQNIVQFTTLTTKNSRSPAWSPNGNYLAFLSNRWGAYNIYIAPVTGGEALQITNLSSSINDFAWSPDGTKIAYTVSDDSTTVEPTVVDENLVRNHLWIVNTTPDSLGNYATTRITSGNFSVLEYDWSSNNYEIVFASTNEDLHFDLWQYQGSIKKVNINTLRINVLFNSSLKVPRMPYYSPDGQWVAFQVNDTIPFEDLCSFRIYCVSNDAINTKILAKTYDEYPYPIGWNSTGDAVYIYENRGTLVAFSYLPVTGDSPVDIYTGTYFMSGIKLNFSRNYLGFNFSKPSIPTEAYVGSLQDLNNFTPVKITDINEPVFEDLGEDLLGETELISWPSSDGLYTIEGLLTYPVNYDENKLYPLVLVVHGGPAQAFGQAFIGDPRKAVGYSAYPFPYEKISAYGYFILRCNIRGSDGYGLTFRRANYQDWGGGDYQDLIAGVNYLINLGLVDSTKLAIIGGSYGGYMSSWAISQTNIFKAAIMSAGSADLISNSVTTDTLEFIPNYLGGYYWQQWDLYTDRSAIKFITSVRTPMLVLAGEQDSRVPYMQGKEFYNSLKLRNIETEMKIYPRSGHSLTEPKLQYDCMQGDFDWIYSHVKLAGT